MGISYNIWLSLTFSSKIGAKKYHAALALTGTLRDTSIEKFY